MDPDPLRLLETAHPLRSPALLPSPPKSRFRLRPNSRLTPETVNKRVNKILKNVDGPTQMSRPRARARFPGREKDTSRLPSLPPVFRSRERSKPTIHDRGRS